MHVSIYRDEICTKGKTKKKNRPKIGLTFVSTECLLYKIGSTNRNGLSDLKITKLFSLRLGLCASNCTERWKGLKELLVKGTFMTLVSIPLSM